MAKTLSAKDKAFQKEREYLKKQINYWREMVVERNLQLSKNELKIMELENIINTLTKEIENHFNMTPEEFTAHVSREKEANQALEMLFSFRNIY